METWLSIQDSPGLQVPALGEVRSGKVGRVVEEERKAVPRRAKAAPRNKREAGRLALH